MLRLPVLGLILAALALTACVVLDTAHLQTGPELLDQVCRHCHGTARICDRLGQDVEFWTATAGRMNRYGANLNEAQRTLVAGHLASLAPGSAPVCGAH